MGQTKQKVNFIKARKKLALLWLIAAALIFLIFIYWTIGTDKLGDKTAEAWGWVLPTIMPTLSLIIGILVIDASGIKEKEKTVEKFTFNLAFYLSIFYLLLIVFLLIFHGNLNKPLFTLFKESNLYLSPIQGLVSAAIGVFYYKKE